MQPAIDRTAANSRTLAMLCHVLAFAGYIVPFGHIIGPLVLWLVKRDDDPAVDHHGKESLNFQITVSLATLAMVVLLVVSMAVPSFGAIVLWILLAAAIAIFDLVFVILAAVAANRGEPYRYPLALRLVR